MYVHCLVLRDLAELEPAENVPDITLCWFKGPCIKDVFPVLKRWRQLRRLTLNNYYMSYRKRNDTCPPFEALGDFILGMNHLSHLHIVPECDGSNYGQLEILRDKVKELILPRRPNFKFNISHGIK